MRIRTLLRLALVAGLIASARPTFAEDPPAPPPRGYIGINMAPVPLIPPEGREHFGLTVEQGTLITHVTKGGPADKAGLKAGDLLVKLNGQALPDTKGIVPDDPASQEAWGKEMTAIGQSVKVGAEVEAVVQREGKEMAVKAVAVDLATMKSLTDEEEEGAEEGEAGEGEEGPGGVKLPKLSEAGEAKRVTDDFEKWATAPPEAPTWFPVTGEWTVEPEAGSSPENHVLKQGHPTDPWAVIIHAGEGRAYGDGVAHVRFQPVSGTEDASGGILVRAKDAKNYYLVRANGLESNFRLYVVKDGVRTQLASVDVKPPALGTWHVIEVMFQGSSLRATLDGDVAVEAADATFKSGWTGLWTKADSVTLFDEFQVTPAAKPAEETK